MVPQPQKSTPEMGSEPGPRQGQDRRSRPTPMFSRYSIWGRRRGNRRDIDPDHNYFVDWIANRRLRLIVCLVSVFVVLDALSTLHIIANGGGEANPLMAQLLEWGMGWFLLVKVATAGLGFGMLAVSPHFPIARILAGVLFMVYTALIIFHAYLLIRIHI